MPSLIVQLDSAARGTGISFQKIAAGGSEAGAAAPPAAPTGGSGGSGGNAAAGGPSAQSAQGTSVEQANNTKASGDKQAASKSGVDATTSTPGKSGGVPVGGGAAGGAAGAPGACAPGLECVPLDFEFQGSFFHLSDFFHQLKRFVKVDNDRVAVGGRLMTVDSFKFTTEEDRLPAAQGRGDRHRVPLAQAGGRDGRSLAEGSLDPGCRHASR